jgi:Basic region leucine zipper
VALLFLAVRRNSDNVPTFNMIFPNPNANSDKGPASTSPSIRNILNLDKPLSSEGESRPVPHRSVTKIDKEPTKSTSVQTGERQGSLLCAPLRSVNNWSTSTLVPSKDLGHHLLSSTSQIPVNTSHAPGPANEKRKLNAAASVRFRARKKQQKEADTANLEKLQRQNKILGDKVRELESERRIVSSVIAQRDLDFWLG